MKLGREKINGTNRKGKARWQTNSNIPVITLNINNLNQHYLKGSSIPTLPNMVATNLAICVYKHLKNLARDPEEMNFQPDITSVNFYQKC